MEANFEALFHITPWTKAVAFITSQLEGNDLIGEYFLLLIDDQDQLTKKDLDFHYPPTVLELVFPDGNYEKCGLEEMRSQVTNKLVSIITELFCRQTPSGLLDPRCKFAVETITFRIASMTTLYSILPEEKELRFIYQTRNAELKKFLNNVFLVKKVIQSYPIKQGSNRLS